MKVLIEKRFPLDLPYGFLQLFAEGGENGAGGDGGDPGGNGGNGGGNSPGKGEKMFSQAELDAAVQRRVARAEKDAVTALAKELGFDSVEAMRAALKKPGDSEKGKGDKPKKDDQPVDVEQLVEEKLKAEREKAYQRLLTAEVKVQANELGFADWEDALKLADLSGAKENDKGEIEGVKEALEKLAQAKPHLLKTKPTSGRFGADIRGGSSQQDERKKRIEHFAKLAQSRGSAPEGVYDPWQPKKD